MENKQRFIQLLEKRVNQELTESEAFEFYMMLASGYYDEYFEEHFKDAWQDPDIEVPMSIRKEEWDGILQKVFSSPKLQAALG